MSLNMLNYIKIAGLSLISAAYLTGCSHGPKMHSENQTTDSSTMLLKYIMLFYVDISIEETALYVQEETDI